MRMMRRRLIVLISAAAVPERRRSLYFGIRELQRHHIDVAQRVWNFATSFTLFDWLNRGDRRWVMSAFEFIGVRMMAPIIWPQIVLVTKALVSFTHSFVRVLMSSLLT